MPDPFGSTTGATVRTYYAIVSPVSRGHVKWEYLDANPVLKQRANDELPEVSAGTTDYTQFWSASGSAS